MMLHVEGLQGYYGASHVLHDVALDVDEGELVALLGRNGAGKTTTLSALMGVVRTRGGRVTVAGEELAGLPPYRRARAGLTLVPSGARVFANLTVEENLEVVRGRRVNGSGEHAWTVARVYEAFPKLATLRANMAGKLSGGERQMLAVGRGLMAHPRVLMLDEPSEGLAPVVLEEIGALLGTLRQTGLTMILAEQNHRFALRYADRAYSSRRARSGTRRPPPSWRAAPP